MGQNRYIADLHFGHENVIRFDGRPFCDLNAMHETIIKNWNAVVQPRDTTYILGDFCWGKADMWKSFLSQLSGAKVLIKGNHDLNNMETGLKKMFQDITDYKEIKDCGRRVIMCHYPILFYRNSYNENAVMLCGHVHTTRENDFLCKWRQELRSTKTERGDSCGNIINVGAMMPYMDYTPRTLNEIIEVIL